MRSMASLPLCALWGPHTHTPQKQNSPTIQALGIEPCMRLILGSALDSPRIHLCVSDGSAHLCSGGHYCRCIISHHCSSSSLGTPFSCTMCRCGFARHCMSVSVMAHFSHRTRRCVCVRVCVCVSAVARASWWERESGGERGRACGRGRAPRERAHLPASCPPSCLPSVVSLKYGELAYASTSASVMPDLWAAACALLPAFNTSCIE
jgi:hypothetical protein